MNNDSLGVTFCRVNNNDFFGSDSINEERMFPDEFIGFDSISPT